MAMEDCEQVFADDPKPCGNLASQYIQSIEGVENPLRKDVEAAGVNLGPRGSCRVADTSLSLLLVVTKRVDGRTQRRYASCRSKGVKIEN